MRGSRAAPALLLGFILLTQGNCSKKPNEASPSAATAPSSIETPGVDLRVFAEPGEDAPISDIAADSTSHHVVAVSRKGKKIGAWHIPSGVWSWKHHLVQQPGLLAIHPVTGEGVLVWQKDRGAELLRFRPATGETVGRVDLGASGAQEFLTAAFDTDRNRVFLTTTSGIFCVDLTANRLSPAGPHALLLPFVQALDLAIDPATQTALVAHAGAGITLLDLTLWGRFGMEIPSTEIPLPPHAQTPSGVAIDSEQGRGYALAGSQWFEIDLNTRQIARRAAVQPERNFAGGRIVFAGSCGRLYVACGDLAEVNLDTGAWRSISRLDGCPAPVVSAPFVGALFLIQQGRLSSPLTICSPY